MEVTLNQLLEGKATRIKNKDYAPTRSYVEPFLERMSKITNDFRVQVKLPDQVTCTSGEGERHDDITYNRVLIQAVLPNKFDNHQEVIGMVYGLDTRKPVVKIYRGALNMACLNLCVFNPSFLNAQELEPEKPINFKCIQPLMEQTSDIKAWLDRLSETEVPYEEEVINENLGSWVRGALISSYDTGYGKVKLATSTAIDAYKLLYEKKDSPYFVNPGQPTTMFNVYNAFTELISNADARDIMNKAEKTLLLKEILGLS